MKNKNKRWVVCVSALVFLLMLSVLYTGMAVGTLASPGDNRPTLFHNDEAWYKDETAPALYLDGRFYIPADVLEMFDYITLTAVRDGENLLVTNSETGDYISLLYTSQADTQAAAANGVIYENINIFREKGYYYLDAEFAAEHLGLFVEYSSDREPSERSVRIFDNTRILGSDELFSTYVTGQDTETESAADETVAETEGGTLPLEQPTRIFLVCGEAAEEDTVSALDTAERLGFTCTLFLASGSERFSDADMNRAVGLIPTHAADAEEMNGQLDALFFRRTHLVLSTGNDEEDKLLARRGYYILKPDFTVDRTTDASVVLRKIEEYGKTREYITVFLGNVWQTETLLMQLAELDEKDYRIGEIPVSN